MKKILFAAVAAMAITGCSQNEEIEKAAQPVEIGFNSVVSKTTRAVSADLDVLKKNGFTVYAYNTGDAAMGTGTLAKNIIEKESITWSTNGLNWNGTKTYYWPNEGKIQFFAYSSTKVAGLAAESTDTYPAITDYEVSSDVKSQEDLLVSKVNDLTKTDATVNFTFSHALTQVNFSIKSKVNDKLTYEVTEISISGVGNKATYDYGTGWAEPTATASYTYPLSTTATDNQVTGDGTTVKALDTTDLMMLLPQTLSNTAKILVKYKVMDKNGDAVYEDALTTAKEIVISSDGNSKWGMGKKVRYTLALTNDATSIAWAVTAVDDWTKETENNNEVETPAN